MLNANVIIASQAVIWLLVAGLLLLVPKLMLSVFGTSDNLFTITLARIFGAELTGLALVSWITRNPTDASTLSGLTLSYLICNSLGFIVCLLGRSSGVLQPAAWLLVALYLLYAVLFGYLRLVVLA